MGRAGHQQDCGPPHKQHGDTGEPGLSAGECCRSSAGRIEQRERVRHSRPTPHVPAVMSVQKHKVGLKVSLRFAKAFTGALPGGARLDSTQHNQLRSQTQRIPERGAAQLTAAAAPSGVCLPVHS